MMERRGVREEKRRWETIWILKFNSQTEGEKRCWNLLLASPYVIWGTIHTKHGDWPFWKHRSGKGAGREPNVHKFNMA
jgi:hypothetical protein